MSNPANPAAIHVNAASSTILLSDQDVLRRLMDTEDSTVERKTAGDYRDCLKTAVAFSNSLPVDDPGIIFVGVRNDGTVQAGLNLESLQKDVSKELSKIYPPIYPQMKMIKDKGGREFLIVIVRGSANRPHFAGPSYVRDGTQTREASEVQFERLIAERNSKTRALRGLIGKEVTWEMVGGRHGGAQGVLADCDQFIITIDGGTYRRSWPLSWVTISFDPANKRFNLVIQHP